MEKPADISLTRRIALWIAAWVVAAVAMAIPNPSILWIFFLFPVGLTGLLNFIIPGATGGENDDQTFSAELIMGWIFYIMLTFFGIVANRKAIYTILYTILCIALAVNVTSCHLILSSKWGT